MSLKLKDLLDMLQSTKQNKKPLKGGVGAPSKANGDALVSDIISPYKVYRALISQSSTMAPTAVVLENTLGFPVTWTRQASGMYKMEAYGHFPIDKTFPTISTSMFNSLVTASCNDEYPDFISINCRTFDGSNFVQTDGVLYFAPFEVKLYP